MHWRIIQINSYGQQNSESTLCGYRIAIYERCAPRARLRLARARGSLVGEKAHWWTFPYMLQCRKNSTGASSLKLEPVTLRKSRQSTISYPATSREMSTRVPFLLLVSPARAPGAQIFYTSISRQR